jgi:hypothetical protein
METLMVGDSLLNDIKEMAIDVQNLIENQKVLEERMNILLLENAKLKYVLEDICLHPAIKNNKTRRES